MYMNRCGRTFMYRKYTSIVPLRWNLKNNTISRIDEVEEEYTVILYNLDDKDDEDDENEDDKNEDNKNEDVKDDKNKDIKDDKNEDVKDDKNKDVKDDKNKDIKDDKNKDIKDDKNKDNKNEDDKNKDDKNEDDKNKDDKNKDVKDDKNEDVKDNIIKIKNKYIDLAPGVTFYIDKFIRTSVLGGKADYTVTIKFIKEPTTDNIINYSSENELNIWKVNKNKEINISSSLFIKNKYWFDDYNEDYLHKPIESHEDLFFKSEPVSFYKSICIFFKGFIYNYSLIFVLLFLYIIYTYLQKFAKKK